MASSAPSKASLTANVDGRDDKLEFSFNPSEYTVAKTSSWNRPAPTKGAKKAPIPEFTGANAQTLQLEIFLDDSKTKDVPGMVNKLLTWLMPTPGSIKSKPRPPIITFVWGGNPALSGFQAYLKSVTAKYTMFDAQGKATRATANITLEEAPLPPAATNPTSGAIHGRSVHVVHEGDSLASIAYAEYGDATIWRGIAAFNEIDDPLRVTAGQRILVPSLAEALRRA
jgi:nucleoid-associated protein YgaU